MRARLGPNVRERAALALDQGSSWSARQGPIAIGPIANGASILIDPGASFGSGLHATTQLCLECLGRLRAETFLDVGTGTGILAIAALALGAKRAVATDVDPAALSVARENAERNDVTLELTREIPAEQFQVVAANILASTLLELAPALVRALAPNGRLILSGLRRGEELAVARAYRALGLHHLETAYRGDWALLELKTSW